MPASIRAGQGPVYITLPAAPFGSDAATIAILRGGVAADRDTLAKLNTELTADIADSVPTAAEVKTLYESNADTNAFDDAAVSKLAGIENAADVTDATNVAAAGAAMKAADETITGTWTYSAPIRAADGSVSAPSLSFSSDATTGVLYSVPTGYRQIGLAIDGQDVARVRKQDSDDEIQFQVGPVGPHGLAELEYRAPTLANFYAGTRPRLHILGGAIHYDFGDGVDIAGFQANISAGSLTATAQYDPIVHMYGTGIDDVAFISNVPIYSAKDGEDIHAVAGTGFYAASSVTASGDGYGVYAYDDADADDYSAWSLLVEGTDYTSDEANTRIDLQIAPAKDKISIRRKLNWAGGSGFLCRSGEFSVHAWGDFTADNRPGYIEICVGKAGGRVARPRFGIFENGRSFRPGRGVFEDVPNVQSIDYLNIDQSGVDYWRGCEATGANSMNPKRFYLVADANDNLGASDVSVSGEYVVGWWKTTDTREAFKWGTDWTAGKLGLYGCTSSVTTLRATLALATGAQEFSINNSAATLTTTPVASQVNGVEVTGAVTTAGPTIAPKGTDTNVDVTLKGKGTGGVKLGATSATPLKNVLSVAAAINFGNVAAGSYNNSSVTLTGVTTDMVVFVSSVNASIDNLIFSFDAYVNAADSVVVMCRNHSGADNDPGSQTLRIVAMQF